MPYRLAENRHAPPYAFVTLLIIPALVASWCCNIVLSARHVECAKRAAALHLRGQQLIHSHTSSISACTLMEFEAKQLDRATEYTSEAPTYPY